MTLRPFTKTYWRNYTKPLEFLNDVLTEVADPRLIINEHWTSVSFGGFDAPWEWAEHMAKVANRTEIIRKDGGSEEIFNTADALRRISEMKSDEETNRRMSRLAKEPTSIKEWEERNGQRA